MSSLPSLVIRPMRRKDAETLAEMMGKLAAFHGDKPVVTAKDFVDGCLGPNAMSIAMVAFMQSKPVGFAIAFDWMNFVRGIRVRTLDLLFVDENCRSMGVGKSLLAAMAEDALENGVQRLDTSAAKGNRKAKAFYERLGFSQRDKSSYRYWIKGEKALRRLFKE